jgi:DNA-binding NtrC family response regulator
MSPNEGLARNGHYRRALRTQLETLSPDELASILGEEAGRDEALLAHLVGLIEAVRCNRSESARALRIADQDDGLVGASAAMLQVRRAIERFSETDSPVLITGESGTGKELVALAIHRRTPKYSDGPFVAINCAGLPHDLIASELFGHERGAFTGAHQRNIGRIENAQGGTVLFDEIGDLPLDLQAHLLRFLETKTIDRVGGRRPIPVDARIIAATNANLPRALAEGQFRQDLFYRLNVLTVELPPLRVRADDLDLLADHFAALIGREIGRPTLTFDPAARVAMRRHRWPGNVRELMAVIRRAGVMANGNVVTAVDLALPADGHDFTAAEAHQVGSEGAASGLDRPLDQARDMFEMSLVRKALELNRHNMKRTAEHLGISRVYLYRLVEKHGLRDDKRQPH